MLKFVWRKMLNKRWLMAALLMGNILLVSIAASSPMYTRASLQRMLTSSFSDFTEANGRYASTAYLVSTLATNLTPGASSIQWFNGEDALAKAMPDALGIPAKHILTNIFFTDVPVRPSVEQEGDSQEVRLGFLSGLEEHCVLLDGEMYSDSPVDGVVEIVVSQKTLVKMDMTVGEELTAEGILGPDGSPLRLRISGCFDADGSDDGYWYKTPDSYAGDLLMSESCFRELAGDYSGLSVRVKGLWFVILDYTKITVDNAQQIHDLTAWYKDYHSQASSISYYNYYDDMLETYLVNAKRITVTLRILQFPVYALLAAFIFMVSGQILSMESSEISVVKSRGAGKRQIILIYLIQSGLVAGAALIIGIPLSMLICQILGSSNAFLEFVSRKALPVQITGTVALYAAGAALFSVVAMVLPAISHARLTIVGQKQKRHRSSRPWFQRFFIDFIMLGVSLYGLYSYNGQKALLAQMVADGAGLDPLLYLSSSLFIIACGLIAIRVVPAIVWLVYSAGKRQWQPAAYASFLQVMRTRSSQGYIVAFLVITLAIGIFNAQSARTINSNEEQRINYTCGAQIVAQERWTNNMEAVVDDDTGATRLTYYEPDSRPWFELPDADVVTKVIFDDQATCAASNNRWTGATVMGINTKEFGQCVDFDSSLLPTHWYNYLNAMAQSPSAVLVSSNTQEKLGYSLGDTITYHSADGFTGRGVIYGFIDYWPGYSPTTNRVDTDGTVTIADNYLIVANFSYVQSQWGVTPYQIWMKCKSDSTQFVYDFISSRNLSLTVFRDRSAQIIAIKNDPIFQGTNGILTVGFVVVLIVCCFGFLIYWILSIRSRELLFGIFRAMGMSMKEIILMLVNEQIFITGVSVGLGVGTGLLVSRLYIPLVQIAYASVDTVVPLRIVSEPADLARLLIVIAAVIAICMVILAVLIRRIKISQALKLGEE